MKKYLFLSFVGASALLLILSCAKPKRTNPFDPRNPNAPGTLLGRVTDTENFPVAGAKMSTSPATSDVFTDSLGNYQTPSLSPQTYQVIVSATSHDTARYTVTISPTKPETLNPQLMYNGPGEITGTVTETVTNRVVKQGFVYTRPDSQLHNVQTDGAGHYRLTDVPSGTYYVVAYKDQYYSKESLQVTLPPKRAIKDIQLQPRNRGWIFGQVVSSDSSGVNGAMLTTIPPADTSFTGGGGYYWFRYLIPGVYILRVANAPKPPLPDSAYTWNQLDTVAVVASDTVVAPTFLLYRTVWWTFDNDPLRSPARGWLVRRGLWFVTDTIPSVRCYFGTDTSANILGSSTIPLDPAHTYDDFTLSLDLLVPTGSPPRGKSDILFRLQDDLHHYRITLADSQAPGGIALFRVAGGVPQMLSSTNLPFGRVLWHRVQISCAGQNIEAWVDGTRRIQVNDNAFLSGRIGLGVSGRGLAFFDNVSVIH